ncbi:MAG: hypothetical protein WCG27_10465, partial [Pseudomonadota bacterium]
MDFTYFLPRGDDFTLANTPSAQQTKYNEYYIVEDRGVGPTRGQRFRLSVASPLTIAIETMMSVVKHSIGMADRTSFPMLFHRGVNGFPSLRDLATRYPDRQIQPSFPGGYQLGQLTPLGGVKAFHPSQLTIKQKAQIILLFAFHQAAGETYLRLEHGERGSILFNGQDFFSNNAAEAIRHLPLEHTTKGMQIDQYWRQIPFTIRPEEAHLLIRELNLVVSRLELLDFEALESLFNPITTILNDWRGEDHLPAFDFLGTWKFNIQQVRHNLYFYLIKEGELPIEVADFMLRPLPTPQPFISLPRSMINGTVPTVDDHSAMELIWSYAFAANDQRRKKAQSAWGNTGGLKSLIKEAYKGAPQTYFVASELDPFAPNANQEIPQVQLQDMNRATLLVKPNNDTESRVVAAIARKIGVHSMVVMNPKYPEVSLEMIVARARQNNARRIILMELPGFTAAQEELLRQMPVDEERGDKKFEVLIVDHHAHSDRDR